MFKEELQKAGLSFCFLWSLPVWYMAVFRTKSSKNADSFSLTSAIYAKYLLTILMQTVHFSIISCYFSRGLFLLFSWLKKQQFAHGNNVVTAVRGTIDGNWDQMAPTRDVFVSLLKQHPVIPSYLAKRNGRTEKHADDEDAKKPSQIVLELRAVSAHLQWSLMHSPTEGVLHCKSEPLSKCCDKPATLN